MRTPKARKAWAEGKRPYGEQEPDLQTWIDWLESRKPMQDTNTELMLGDIKRAQLCLTQLEKQLEVVTEQRDDYASALGKAHAQLEHLREEER